MKTPIKRPIVTQNPENSETPLPEIRSWVTPNSLFFVRNHFEEPVVDPDEWRLQVHGHLRRARTWTLPELMELPEHTVFATMECAGNGRSFLRSEEGVQWGAGAIGHAEWSGVPLSAVLEQSSTLTDALEVLCEGADSGTEPDHPEVMRFARGLPIQKALHPDTLLAFRMNGEPLSPSHGAPVRLVVPGWYGVCSVKWICRLEVLDYPYEGYFQARKYTIRKQDSGAAVRTSRITRIAVKSEIIRPREGAELQPGVNRISGIAWAGEDPVRMVEVSADGGRKWDRAALVGPQAPYSWTLWEYLWHVEKAGEHVLLTRATSASGETQPAWHDKLRGGYMINFSRPHMVRVTAKGRAEDAPGDAATRLQDLTSQAQELSLKRLDVEMDIGFIDGGGI
ncbi:MAG TPA: sulfite oxidase [Acidobacteriota bacterium]|jgi:DMSO/TMAO reductase YedYZ molybdopterin-dependent catalytic subunit